MTKQTDSQPNPTGPDSDDLPEVEEGDDTIIGRAFRWSLLVIVSLGAIIAAGIYFFNRKPEAGATTVVTAGPATVRHTDAVVPKVMFTDISKEAGITWTHENGAYGRKLLPETMGGGCAFFDYDNDGDQDLLLVNSSYWPWHNDSGKPGPKMCLYANDGTGHFTDVTKEAGLDLTCYGMGVAVGDYDNDGWVDVFISAVGLNHLFHNDHGKFVEVTLAAGVAGGDNTWSTSCGFIDYDNDGDLDLFVCNYLTWSKEDDEKQACKLDGKNPAYCPPTSFEGTYPYLYRNDGDGRFTDVSEQAGLHVQNENRKVPLAKSLGLAPIDLDKDGWIDFVLANDTVQNLVFLNRHDGTFQEIGKVTGIAFDPAGNARGAMGIDAAFFRNNATLGLVIGNFANENSSLFVSQRAPLRFADEANATGFGPPGRLALKFGVFFFDYDLDSRLDVLTANGHIETEISKIQESQRYEQPAHLFWNCGWKAKNEFVMVDAAHCGEDVGKPMVGRGATYADIDGDGDLDVLLTGIGQTPRLLRNDQTLGNHFLRFKLIGKKSNRDAIGAWIDVELGPDVLRRQVMPTRSYLSQVELPVTIGLGQTPQLGKVSIRWPSGSTQVVAEPAMDRLMTIEEE